MTETTTLRTAQRRGPRTRTYDHGPAWLVLTRGLCVPAHFTAKANRVPAGIANRYVAVGAFGANWPRGHVQPIASRRGKPLGTRAKHGLGIVREKKCDPACTRTGAAELVVA